MRFLRYAFLLFTIALIGPGAAAVLATNASAAANTVRMASAPSNEFRVDNIQFSLEKGDNGQPANPSNRFRFGTRGVWAFWEWSGAKNEQPVHYVLRFGNTDVAFGELKTDDDSGRMELLLQRSDGDYLMIGTFRLILEPRGDNNGPVREATFEIYDDDGDGGNDNGGNNNNNNNTNNNNNNNANNNDNDFNFNDNDFENDNGNDNN
jgi:hypothetical protein